MSWLLAQAERRMGICQRLALPTSAILRATHKAWLADILARNADHPAHRLVQLLPWRWRQRQGLLSQAA